MALCGVNVGIFNLCLQNEESCFQRFWVRVHSKKRCKGVSSSDLQKEHRGEMTFLKTNSILLRYNTLLIILYWKDLVKVSIVTFRGNRQISFQSNVVWNKDSKYFCDLVIELLQKFWIEYSSLLFSLLITYTWLFLIKCES